MVEEGHIQFWSKLLRHAWLLFLLGASYTEFHIGQHFDNFSQFSFSTGAVISVSILYWLSGNDYIFLGLKNTFRNQPTVMSKRELIHLRLSGKATNVVSTRRPQPFFLPSFWFKPLAGSRWLIVQFSTGYLLFFKVFFL